MSTINVDTITSTMGVVNIDYTLKTTNILPQGSDTSVNVGNVQIGLNNTNQVLSNNNKLDILNGSNGQTTIVGAAAGIQLTDASQQNTLFGTAAGFSLTDASFNTIVGANAGRYTTGGNNTFFGANAAVNNTTGLGNACFGSGAGGNLNLGNSNTFIGNGAGNTPNAASIDGQSNVAIGSGSLLTNGTVSGEFVLGSNAITVLRCAVTSITALSDGRDKKEIETLPVGLDFINSLKPVSFVWNERDEKGKHDIKDFGFIAQDLKKSQEDVDLADTLKLVYDENPEKLEASYGKLIPILVKAIQELTDEIEILKNK